MKLLLLMLIPCLAGTGEKIEWQDGPCRGGNRPARACKTCERCAYCGKKPGKIVKGERPENSATCAVCEKPKR